MQPQISTFDFPQSAKTAWLDYIKGINQDPYKDYETLGPVLAKQLIKTLTDVSNQTTSNKDSFDATALLIEIEAHKSGLGSSATIIHNFPIDEVNSPHIDTPTIANKFDTNGKGVISELSQLAWVNAIALHPLVHPDIAAGHPFQDICPRDGKEEVKGNAGLTEPFGPHTEKAFEETEEPPQALSLLGIRNWTRTPTTLSILEHVLPYLTKAEKKLLEEDKFVFPAGAALNTDNQLQFHGPIMTKVNGTNEFRFKSDTVYSDDEKGEKLIVKLKKILTQPDKYLGIKVSVVVGPGVLLTFNNRTLAHERPAILGDKAPRLTGVVPKKGDERWLQRETLRRKTSSELALC